MTALLPCCHPTGRVDTLPLPSVRWAPVSYVGTDFVQSWPVGEGRRVLTAHSRYPHATPSPRLVAERLLRQSGTDLRSLGASLPGAARVVFGHKIPAFASAVYGPRGLRFVLNAATALLVLSLPLSVAASTGALTTTEPVTVAASLTSVSDDGASRVSTASRGLLAGSRSPVTVASEDAHPVVEYSIKKGDT